MNIGLIGCGKYMVKWFENTSIIEFLYNNNITEIKINAICDPVLEKMLFCKKIIKNICEKKSISYHEPKMYRNFKDLLEDIEVDAIVIATPHWWNAEMGYQACLKKKYVFCEKPLGINIIDGRKLVNIIKKNNIIFQSGFHFKNSVLPLQIKTFINNNMNTIVEIEIQGGKCGIKYDNENENIQISDITKKPLIDNNDFNLFLGNTNNYISSLADNNNGKKIKYHSDFISKISDSHLPFGIIDKDDNIVYSGWRLYFNYGNGSMTSVNSHLFDLMIYIMDFDNSDTGPYKIEPSQNDFGTKIYYKKYFEDVILKHTEGNYVLKFIDIDDNWLTYRPTSFEVESNMELNFNIADKLFQDESSLGLRILNMDNWIANIINDSNTNSVYYAERGHYASILSYLFNLSHNLPIKKTLYFDFKKELFTLDETNSELDESTNLFLYDNTRNYQNLSTNIICPLDYGAQGDGITDDSDIIKNLISENIIIDLGNKTYKCNKTIDINYDNVIIQNGILDFTDIEKNETFYSESTTEWTIACGIRILGSQNISVPLTYEINHQTNHYYDFVRINNTDNSFNNDDFVFIDSDIIHHSNGGGGTQNGLKNGEIIQIDRVNEDQWEKYSFDENNNDRIIYGEKPPDKNDDETQLNFVNSTYEDYLIQDNAKISKLNLRKNIILRNLTLKSKNLSNEELNNPDRFRAHRTEWRNEKKLLGNEYLGTAIWIQYGYNINIENCKIYNWYDTGIVIARSIQCNINNLECNHIYSNGKGYGINIRDASQKINITNSFFTDQRHPISIGGLDGISRNIKITNNSINKSRDAAIDSHSAGQFITIDNNHIICEGSDAEHDGIIIEGCNSIITNNIINGFVRNGIKIKPTFNNIKNVSYIISGNSINAKPDYTYSSGIKIVNDNSIINNLLISDNTINNTFSSGVYIKDNNGGIHCTNLNGNNITLCEKGIYIDNLDNINITNNIISSQTNLFKNIDNLLFINNYIKNYIEKELTNTIFILYFDTVNNSIISNNKLNGCYVDSITYKYGVYMVKCNSCEIKSNNIYMIDNKEMLVINIFLSDNNNNIYIKNNLIDSKKKSRYGIYLKHKIDYVINNNIIKNSDYNIRIPS